MRVRRGKGGGVRAGGMENGRGGEEGEKQKGRGWRVEESRKVGGGKGAGDEM